MPSRMIVAAATAAWLLTAGTALAQPADKAALGAAVAHEMFEAIDFRSMMRSKALESMDGSLGGLEKLRPEWKPLMAEALGEELEADQPAIERIVGARLAAEATPEELQAGLIMLRDPVARSMFAAAGSGGERPKGAPKFGPEFIKAAQSPAGASFMRKMRGFKEMMGGDAQSEILAELIPGFFQRFGAKAAAAEQARAARR